MVLQCIFSFCTGKHLSLKCWIKTGVTLTLPLSKSLSVATISILSFRFLLFVSLRSPFGFIPLTMQHSQKKLKFNHNKQICSPTGHHWAACSNSARYSNQWPCSLNTGPELVICMTVDELAVSLSLSLSLSLSANTIACTLWSHTHCTP